MIKINLDSIYEPISISEDFIEIIFISEIENDELIPLYVRFSNINDEHLPNVFNLGFGPIDQNGNIDDLARLKHKNLSKLFSTIVFYAISFLENNKGAIVGIDGSDESRAYLYHRIFKSNKEELSEILVTIGIDWYVKLLRNGDVERDLDGLPYFKPILEPFNHLRKNNDLYRYYLIELK